MKRRDFIALVAAAAALPCTARAQPRSMPVVGYLGTSTPDAAGFRIPSIRQGLSEAGFVEGRNVAIEYRWAEGQLDRLPALAADLVRRGVDVIITPGSLPATLAAKGATTTIPIVFETGADPVASGLVASLQRPGGNITGVTTLNFQLAPKRLELLSELVPKATVVGHLINPAIPAAGGMIKALEAAATSRGLQVHVVPVATDHDIDAAFATLLKVRARGLVISPDPFINTRLDRLAQLGLRHSLPAIAQNRDFVAAGGLAGYGGSVRDSYRLVGVHTGRLLKGEKPSELPVLQATKIELFINAKTAKTLAISIPPAVIARADEVVG